jgi:hypothetical protein
LYSNFPCREFSFSFSVEKAIVFRSLFQFGFSAENDIVSAVPPVLVFSPTTHFFSLKASVSSQNVAS